MIVTALTRGDFEAVPLTEVKEFCRLSSGDIEDASLRRMVRSARTACENWARHAISPRQFTSTFKLPRWENSGLRKNLVDPDDVMDGPRLRGPLISVDNVILRDRLANELQPPAYGVFLTEKRIRWDEPTTDLYAYAMDEIVTRRALPRFNPDAVTLEVTYTAGYRIIQGGEPNSTAEKLCEAPDDIVEAICLTVADVYENRGANDTSVTRSIPARARALMKPYWTPAI